MNDYMRALQPREQLEYGSEPQFSVLSSQKSQKWIALPQGAKAGAFVACGGHG